MGPTLRIRTDKGDMKLYPMTASSNRTCLNEPTVWDSVLPSPDGSSPRGIDDMQMILRRKIRSLCLHYKFHIGMGITTESCGMGDLLSI